MPSSDIIDQRFETFFPNLTKAELWERASDWNYIAKHEFAPIFIMTGLGGPMSEVAQANMLPKTFYILLFGVIPIDAQKMLKLTITDSSRSTDVECFYEEESKSTLIKAWKHRRTLREENGGVMLEDHLEITPKIKCLRSPMKAIYGKLFRRRQQRLLGYFEKQKQVQEQPQGA